VDIFKIGLGEHGHRRRGEYQNLQPGAAFCRAVPVLNSQFRPNFQAHTAEALHSEININLYIN